MADSPALGAKCPDALLRLFDYSLRERDYYWLRQTDASAIADQDDEDAAVAVFVSQQHELRRRGVGSRLEGDVLHELSKAAQWTRRVLIDRRKVKGAKLLELGLTSGAPLGICIGARRPMPFRFGGRPHDVGLLPVLGCGCIFLDRADANGGRAYWLRWCSEHEPSKHQAARVLRTARTPPRFRGFPS